MWGGQIMRKHTLLTLLAFGSITLSGCYVDLGFIQFGSKGVTDENHKDGRVIYDAEKDSQTISTYYADIDGSKSGEALLSDLRNLNLSNRVSTVGYKDMPYLFCYTDYDPAYTKWNSDGVPYSGHILSFYSGKQVIMGECDREHVWPASRLPGGRDNNVVDKDIYMPRPTCDEENQDRGNSCYITDMNSTSKGWDPVEAFGHTIGVHESIRGECARIIFYCMTADENCVLNDDPVYVEGGVTNMGKISDLMEWACENPVNLREKRRQVGGQYLQGNRNAFVDHPEYACKIWGNATSRTKAACQSANYEVGGSPLSSN